MTDSFYRNVFGNYDRVDDDSHKHLGKPYAEKSGVERLVTSFTPNEFGEWSNEMNTVMEVGCLSMFLGGMYGGVKSSKKAYLEFFHYNQATAFNDHLEAKKRLQDKVTNAFAKGAFRFGWRLTLFSTTYVGLTSAVAVYRNKNGIIEHVVAGGLAGSVYKFNGGPRSMLVGCLLGNVLGLIAGSTTFGLLKVAGVEVSDVQRQKREWYEARNEKWKAGLKKDSEDKENELVLQNTKKTEGDSKLHLSVTTENAS